MLWQGSYQSHGKEKKKLKYHNNPQLLPALGGVSLLAPCCSGHWDCKGWWPRWNENLRVLLTFSFLFWEPTPSLPHLTMVVISLSHLSHFQNIIYHVGQPAGKNVFGLPTMVGSHLFPNDLWSSQRTQAHKKSLCHWRELHNHLLIQRIHSLHVKPFPLISKIKDKPIWPHALAHSRVDTFCTFHVFPGSSFGVHLEAQQGSIFWGPSKPHQCLHSVPDLSP